MESGKKRGKRVKERRRRKKEWGRRRGEREKKERRWRGENGRGEIEEEITTAKSQTRTELTSLSAGYPGQLLHRIQDRRPVENITMSGTLLDQPQGLIRSFAYCKKMQNWIQSGMNKILQLQTSTTSKVCEQI